MKSRHVLLVAAAVLLFWQDFGAFAQGPFPAPPALQPFPFVSPLFGDDMVLQRGKVDTIWGWSEPGDTVRVQIGHKAASAVAGPDRRWEVKLQPPATGGPYTLRISGRETVELHNVMVGDVWLCTGQSNMLVPLGVRFTATMKSRQPTTPIFASLNCLGILLTITPAGLRGAGRPSRRRRQRGFRRLRITLPARSRRMSTFRSA